MTLKEIDAELDRLDAEAAVGPPNLDIDLQIHELQIMRRERELMNLPEDKENG